MTRTSLYDLFIPPRGFMGDFGMLCGFTASRGVLDRLRRGFSGETARPVLAAFLHPTPEAISDLPGVAWLWVDTSGMGLLHAKVALLGFRATEGEEYRLRLAVSTGNWTEDPLTDSIDMFWHIEVDPGTRSRQDGADVRAAARLFDWLRARADCGLIERTYDGRVTDARLRAAVTALPRSEATTRFIDSREAPLLDQISARIPRAARRLVVGSGYFEAAGEGLGILDDVRTRLAGKRDTTLDLVINPAACQGVAHRAKALAAAGWRFRAPYSAMHAPGAKLHAKFILADAGEAVLRGRIYLGSGNLSRAGMARSATGGGNLEAGVVLDLPEGARAGRLGDLVPARFDAEIAPTTLEPGADFDPPAAAPPPPSVTWLEWTEGRLIAPGGAEVDVVGPSGAVARTPLDWPAPAPAVVTLAGSGWRLPVIAEDALIVPRPAGLSAADVLARLGAFPHPAEDVDGEEDFDAPLADAGEPLGPESGADPAGTSAQEYPIRRMMGLLARLGEQQKAIRADDWPRWCRELSEDLRAIAPQEEAMIGFFRAARANPLPVLADPRLRGAACEGVLLEKALDRIAEAWGLEGLASLWDGEETA